MRTISQVTIIEFPYGILCLLSKSRECIIMPAATFTTSKWLTLNSLKKKKSHIKNKVNLKFNKIMITLILWFSRSQKGFFCVIQIGGYSSLIHKSSYMQYKYSYIGPKLKYCLFAVSRPTQKNPRDSRFYCRFKIYLFFISEIFVPVRFVFQ